MSVEKTTAPALRWKFCLLSIAIVVSLSGVLLRGLYTRTGLNDLDELRALLTGSEFQSDESGQAFGYYTQAVDILLSNDWERKQLTAQTRNFATLPSVNQMESVNEAARLVLRGAKHTDPGIPTIRSSLETTVTTPMGPLDIINLQMAADAALVVARQHMIREEYDDATRYGKAALAMSLHLMSAKHDLMVVTGMAGAARAIATLRDIASAQGEESFEKACDVARLALDQQFNEIKSK